MCSPVDVRGQEGERGKQNLTAYMQVHVHASKPKIIIIIAGNFCETKFWRLWSTFKYNMQGHWTIFLFCVTFLILSYIGIRYNCTEIVTDFAHVQTVCTRPLFHGLVVRLVWYIMCLQCLYTCMYLCMALHVHMCISVQNAYLSTCCWCLEKMPHCWWDHHGTVLLFWHDSCLQSSGSTPSGLPYDCMMTASAAVSGGSCSPACSYWSLRRRRSLSAEDWI